MSDLPTGAEPLTLADGRVIMPNGRMLRVVDPTPATDESITRVDEPALITGIVVQRKLDDLPDSPRVMNVVGAVLAYKLFGLSDEDVASATGTDVERITRIVSSSVYSDLRRDVVRSVLDSEASGIRDLFQRHSREAVNALVDTLGNGKRADRLVAARDILDRAGHRPADVVEHRHRMDGGLKIEIVRREGSTEVPTLEMEMGDE